MAKISICYMPDRDNTVVAFGPENKVWGSAEISGRFRVAVVKKNPGLTSERVSRQQYVYNPETNSIKLARKDPPPEKDTMMEEWEREAALVEAAILQNYNAVESGGVTNGDN